MARPKVWPYSPDHYGQLREWFLARNLESPPEWALSDTGFIVHNVAAGFLFLTNSKVAYLDCFIANPVALSPDRSEALDAIVEAALWQAKDEYDAKMIVCDSKFPAIERRARKLGFSNMGEHRVYARRI